MNSCKPPAPRCTCTQGSRCMRSVACPRPAHLVLRQELAQVVQLHLEAVPHQLLHVLQEQRGAHASNHERAHWLPRPSAVLSAALPLLSRQVRVARQLRLPSLAALLARRCPRHPCPRCCCRLLLPRLAFMRASRPLSHQTEWLSRALISRFTCASKKECYWLWCGAQSLIPESHT